MAHSRTKLPPAGGRPIRKMRLPGWPSDRIRTLIKVFLFDPRLSLKLSGDTLKKTFFKPDIITILDIPADSGRFHHASAQALTLRRKPGSPHPSAGNAPPIPLP